MYTCSHTALNMSSRPTILFRSKIALRHCWINEKWYDRFSPSFNARKTTFSDASSTSSSNHGVLINTRYQKKKNQQVLEYFSHFMVALVWKLARLLLYKSHFSTSGVKIVLIFTRILSIIRRYYPSDKGNFHHENPANLKHFLVLLPSSYVWRV